MGDEKLGPLEAYFTLAEAAQRFFPAGTVTQRSLRTEVMKGRLRVTRIAGKDFVSESAIRAMLEACTCPARAKAQDSISGDIDTAPTSGSSSMARAKSAQTAARTTLQELSERLKATSRENTRRRMARRDPTTF